MTTNRLFQIAAYLERDHPSIAAELRKFAPFAEDHPRIEWIEQFIETGVLESSFELDGGVHLTLSSVGDSEEVAYRNKNSFREAVDLARRRRP